MLLVEAAPSDLRKDGICSGAVSSVILSKGFFHHLLFRRDAAMKNEADGESERAKIEIRPEKEGAKEETIEGGVHGMADAGVGASGDEGVVLLEFQPGAELRAKCLMNPVEKQEAGYPDEEAHDANQRRERELPNAEPEEEVKGVVEPIEDVDHRQGHHEDKEEGSTSRSFVISLLTILRRPSRSPCVNGSEKDKETEEGEVKVGEPGNDKGGCWLIRGEAHDDDGGG